MENLNDCTICGNSYLAIRTDIYKDGREFVYCDCCGAMATKNLWQKANKIVTKVIEQSPITFGGRCERHLSAKPCQFCADEKEAGKESLFKPFWFKACTCPNEIAQGMCKDRNNCMKIVSQNKIL